MRKRNSVRNILIISAAAIAASGCANTESGVLRHKEKNINGVTYDTAANAENIYGVESDGLNSNPGHRPSSSILGDSANLAEVQLTVVPAQSSAVINSVVEFEVQIKAKLKDTDDEFSAPAVPTRVVVTLDGVDGASGSLEIAPENIGMLGNDSSRDKNTPTRIAVNVSQSVGKFKVRVNTGNTYSKNKPVYFLNAWQADADDPGTAEIMVKPPAVLDESGKNCIGTPCVVCGEDTKCDIAENNLSLPEDLKEASSTLDAKLVLLDPEVQNVLIGGDISLRVKLVDGKGCSTAADCASSSGLSEQICWRVAVSAAFTTDSSASAAAPSAVGAIAASSIKADASWVPNKDRADEGCMYSDKNGMFTLNVNTGLAVGTKFYVDFFHINAKPAVYTINTAALPAIIGELGDAPGADLDGDGKPDDALRIDDSKSPEETAEPTTDGRTVVSESNTEEFIKDILGDGCSKADSTKCKDETLAEIYFDNCFAKTDIEHKTNLCTLEKDDNGNWILIGPDGNPVKIDTDGDGKDDSGVTIGTETDDDGSSYYTGIDTDGDGKPDIAPDPCLYDTEECSAENVLVWRRNESSKFCRFGTFSTGINKTIPIYTAVAAKENVKGATSCVAADSLGPDDAKLGSLTGTIVKSSASLNDGQFNSKNGEDSVVQGPKDDKGRLYDFTFWTGTAKDALYFITVENANIKTAKIPVATNEYTPVPVNPGDKPTEDQLKDAITPPAGMESFDTSLGDLEFFLPAGQVQEMTSPVIKTLNVKIGIRKKGAASGNIGRDVPTYWKVTRGPSMMNNGTITSTQALTDSDGVAVNKFYTGTAYNSEYIITVFTPNIRETGDENKNGINNEPIPYVFKLTTENASGKIDGSSAADDPELPEGDTVEEGGTTRCCKDWESPSAAKCKICEGDTTFNEVNGEKTNSDYPQIDCGDSFDFNTCKEGDLEKLSTGQCNGDCKNLCLSGTKSDKVGCLKLSKEDNDPITIGVNAFAHPKVKLTWYHGDEETPVRDFIYWTLKGNDEADGKLVETKTLSSKKGIAMGNMSSGTYETSYLLSAMHPNIHTGTDMKPVSFVVNVTSSMTPDGTRIAADENTIHFSASLNEDVKKELSKHKKTADSVVFYSMSSATGTLKCNPAFAIQSKSNAQSACNANASVNDGSSCGILGITGDANTNDSKYTSDLNVTDPEETFLTYAVAYDNSGNAVAYACSSSDTFDMTSATIKLCDEIESGKCGDECKDYNAGDSKENKCQKKVRELNIDLTLDAIPGVIGNKYDMQTLIDLGPLLDMSVVDKTCTGSNSVPCILYTIRTAYQKFVDEGTTLGTSIIEKVTNYIDYSDENTSKLPQCFEALKCKTEWKQTDTGFEKIQSDNNASTLVAACGAFEKPDTLAEPKKTNSIKNLKACSCICGKAYYWTGVNSIGKKLTPKIKSLLASLIDQYIKPESIEDAFCGAFDSLQYVTLQGFVSIDKDKEELPGTVSFNNFIIPFLNKEPISNEKMDGIKVIQGSWDSAEFSDAGELKISDFNLNFTYGEMAYAILGKLFGAPSEGGKFNLAGGICSRIFKEGASLNLGIFKLDLSKFKFVCDAAVSTGNEYVANFAGAQFVNLGMTMNGSGDLKYGADPQEINGAQVYDVIENGRWSGVAHMSGHDRNITGLWSAKWSSSKELLPQLAGSDDALAAYKKENSACKKYLKEKPMVNEDSKVFNSNDACLNGNLNNISGRADNSCDNPNCQGKTSIIVCEDGKLNPTYAKATAADIIRDANDKCIGSTDDNCNNNPEIINGGNGISNYTCATEKNKCSEKACSNNPSIIVCSDGHVIECPDGDDDCPYTDKNSKSVKTTLVCDACAASPNDPGCVMNKDDLKACSNSNPEPGSKLLAVWDTFNPKGIMTSIKELNDYISNNRSSLLPDSGDGEFSIETSNSIKAVMGTNGAVSAIGTQDVATNFTVKWPENCKISKVTFKVLGNERLVSYSVLEKSNVNKVKLITSVSDWHTVEAIIAEGNNHLLSPFTISSEAQPGYSNDVDHYKDIRLDEVNIYGLCEKPSDTDKESSPGTEKDPDAGTGEDGSTAPPDAGDGDDDNPEPLG